MTVREEQEKREKEYFNPHASFSSETKGRDIPEEKCDIRTEYQRDRDRILHCKAFRRLKQKTQVFLAPEGDHYRTRLTHTLEVSQIARTVAKALSLNEDLTEAIALGHDLGHTPFGHAGERTLNRICPLGFAHNEQSVRVVEFLEKDGEGLNLTKEVRDGIRNHCSKGCPGTLEGKVVRLADKIAYIHHDVDDAIRGGILEEKDIPNEFTYVLGETAKDRLNCMIHDIISNSMGKDDINMSAHIQMAMMGLREYMFENVYTNPIAKSEEVKAEKMLMEMYDYFLKHITEIPEDFLEMEKKTDTPKERIVCDYIACMTDKFAINIFKRTFIPVLWKK